MSEGQQTDARPRPERRWTLSGLMFLIALLTVPLALYDHHLREAERRRTVTIHYLKRLVGEANERLETPPVDAGNPAIGGEQRR
jgi:hypothetical protein